MIEIVTNIVCSAEYLISIYDAIGSIERCVAAKCYHSKSKRKHKNMKLNVYTNL